MMPLTRVRAANAMINAAPRQFSRANLVNGLGFRGEVIVPKLQCKRFGSARQSSLLNQNTWKANTL